ncbi:hypothetical protein GCM10011341_09730 [Frigidibacter albus]|nr:hypothetical protein GCM10011341_09730 [Frigidibacter albus]
MGRGWAGVWRNGEVGRDKARHCLDPARAGRLLPEPLAARDRGRTAPDLAGVERPPGAGRALAEPFGGPSGKSCEGTAWRRRWPSPWRAEWESRGVAPRTTN